MSLLDKIKKKNPEPLEADVPPETINITPPNKTVVETEENDTKIEIKVPIRVRMAMVTMIKTFDKSSKGVSNKGGNLKELKYEIIELANRMSEN